MVLGQPGIGRCRVCDDVDGVDGQIQIYSISQDGALFRWAYVAKAGHVDDGDVPKGHDLSPRWRIVQRHYFLQNGAKVNCAAYHSSSNMLVAGFSNGLFGLYELPEFNMIHTLR